MQLMDEIRSENGVNILSLFDGMACGLVAMIESGVKVNRYIAYEIDKYAVKTSQHNFPFIEHKGDVFQADFTEYRGGLDYLIGGSPCTYWSIAQKNNRETEASGLGWELFSQYVRALHESKPKFFIYENNKSMSNAIRESITNAFGFEPICINSALVSAQNRQRLYWVGRRNEDGSYSKVKIEQPADRGILLRDILDSGVAWQDKSFAYTTRCNDAIPSDTLSRHRHTMIAEPVNITDDDKTQCLRATCYKDDIRNMVGNNVDRRTCVEEPVDFNHGAETTYVRCRGRKGFAKYEARIDCKEGTITAERVCEVAEPIEMTEIHIRNNAHIVINDNAIRGVQDKNNASCAECFYEFTDRKSNTLTTAHTPKIIENINNALGYAIACEFDSNGNPKRAISVSDGKTYTVYKVDSGQITINESTYPIKLNDGFYIIRKLTVGECKKLQTVPDWYEFPVSNSQAYKMLGNGWTCSVISHLINATLENK